MTAAIHTPVSLGATFRPMFRADWREALFIHFRVDPSILQPLVPLELDCRDRHAYISLVAFTQARLRPTIGGRLTEWLSAPLAHHEFLNLRTYVRHEGERGIYFLAEWIPNRLAAFLGPRLYGLPYRLGRLNYHGLHRTVTEDARVFAADATVNTQDFAPARAGTESEFLLERYTAFTHRNGILRRFRIEHQPWMQIPASVSIKRNDLTEPWLPQITLCSAHYSPGLSDVAIGRPKRIELSPLPVLRGRARVGAGRNDSWFAFILPAATLALYPVVPAWAFMWSLALAIFFAFKWLTYRRATVPTTPLRRLGYLLAWPGMDAAAFLDPRRRAPIPSTHDWLAALLKIITGAMILWSVLPHLSLPPLLTGWLGMVGLILCLHFGAFDLIARLWQLVGVDAKPLMNRPAASQSLADFWGNRWNTGFRELSHTFLYRPLHRRVGPTIAFFVTFAASGLIHDLVTTLPARGGYGRPTLYFLLQAVGMRLERALRLRRGFTGWLFTALFTLGFAWLLFPPPFVNNVILPFLKCIGSLPKGMP